MSVPPPPVPSTMLTSETEEPPSILEPTPAEVAAMLRSLSPPSSLSLSAAALYLLPRLVQHRRISAAQMSLLKLAVLRSECLPPFELYLALFNASGPQVKDVDELVDSLQLMADDLAALHTDDAEVVLAPAGSEVDDDGSIVIPHVPSAVSLDEDAASLDGFGFGWGPMAGSGSGSGSGGLGIVGSTSTVSLPALLSPTRPVGRHRLRTSKVKGSAVRGLETTGKPHSLLVRKDICVLYYAKEMKTIAEHVSALSGGTIILHEVSWGKFNDGFPHLVLKNVKDIRYHACAYLASLTNTEGLFEQLSVMHALPRYLAKRFTIICPYFPTGTMERIDKVGEVATASSLARLLSTTPPACNGPSQLCILDIHALQNLFYFSDQLHVRLKSCIGLLKERLTALRAATPDAPPISIAFPDEGAFKRFHKKFPSYDTIVCDKRRVGDKRIVTIKEGRVEGMNCVIVDDLVQSGGTLLNCAKALLEAGAASVSCYVTHAVFPKESWRKFVEPDPTTGKPLMDRFWITDTIPTVAEAVRDFAPFEVLPIASVVLSLLQVL